MTMHTDIERIEFVHSGLYYDRVGVKTQGQVDMFTGNGDGLTDELKAVLAACEIQPLIAIDIDDAGEYLLIDYDVSEHDDLMRKLPGHGYLYR